MGPESEAAAAPLGTGTGSRRGSHRASKGELDIKAQIEKQKELQQLASSQAKARTSSAPTSPLKEKNTKASFFGKVSTFSQVVSQKVDAAKDAAGNIRVPGLNRGKCFTLLVIDDANTDWSKYFRGRRLHEGEYDIKVEQAEFKELSVAASVDGGATASVLLYKSGNKVVRSFQPDFILVRQNVKDGPQEDYKNILLGFQYGNVPSVNSLESIYNFQDKPWVYGHLIDIQRKMGKDNFPIVNQSYYPNHHELSCSPKFPCVFKVGHAHGGQGKVKVDNEARFQDMTSVVAVSNTYCTVEPYIDSKFDLHVQKIGTNYKSLMRKSLSGNWKTNIGQSILEEVSVSEKHKAWIDAVSELFGGMGICSLEAVVGKDGKEYIIEINDCATTLLGESQEEDRKNIAELVITQMEEKCKPEVSSEGEEEGEGGGTIPQSSSKPGALASAARQVSRTSLLSGGGGQTEQKSSMASTVLAYANKAKDKVGEARGVSAAVPTPPPPNAATAAAAAADKPEEKAANKQPTPAAAPVSASKPEKPSLPKREPPPPQKPSGSAIDSKPSTSAAASSKSGLMPSTSGTAPPPKPEPPAITRNRHDSQDSTDSSASSSSSSASEESTVSNGSSASSTVKKADISASKSEVTANKQEEKVPSTGGAENGGGPSEDPVEGEDTMKNLRKTFAGIFGDM